MTSKYHTTMTKKELQNISFSVIVIPIGNIVRLAMEKGYPRFSTPKASQGIKITLMPPAPQETMEELPPLHIQTIKSHGQNFSYSFSKSK